MHLPGNRAKDLEPGSKKAFHAEDFRKVKWVLPYYLHSQRKNRRPASLECPSQKME
jgi:hypothetical protein